MRIYLIIMIALALLVSYGCSDKKSAGPTPDETAKLARSGGATSSGDNTVSNPDMDEARKRREEERKRRNGETEDQEESGEEKDKESDGEAEDGEEEKAKSRTPPPTTGRGARRRRKVETPSFAGGNLAEEKKRRDAEKEAKQQEQSAGNSGGLGSNRPPARDDEPEEEVKTASLYERAEKAFAMKHDPEGFQYLYAHYLTDENALESHPLSWYTGIKEPRIGLRWGVAVTYSPGKFEGDPPKIGDAVETSNNSSGNRNRNNRRRGGGNDLGGAGGGNSAGGSIGISGGRGQRNSASGRSRNNARSGNSSDTSDMVPSEALEYYTGDFGTELVRRYEMRRRHSDAFYGSIMKEIETELKEEEETDNNQQANQSPRQRRRSSSGGGDFGSLGGGANSDLERARRDRQQNARSGSRRGSDGPEYEADETALAPGLMFLGLGNKSELLGKAKAYDIDVLVVFEVKINHTERRNGDTSTKSLTKMMVYSVKNGDPLVKDTKSLSHLAVASARAKNRGDDPVQIELDKAFKNMADEAFKAGEMPDYDADTYRKRYEYLVEKDYENPLPVLVEIKHYLNSGYITQNDYVAACEKLLGSVAAQDLIDGDLKKKEHALKDYLPGEYSVKVSSGGEDFR